MGDQVFLDLAEIRIDVDGMSNCRSEMVGIEELAADIKRDGLLNDLGAWQPQGKNYYVLNYGYRRYHAIKWLHDNDAAAFKALGKIGCKVFKGTLDQALVLNLIENIKRKSINHADLIRRVYYLHESQGMTEQQISTALGRSQSDISGMMGVHLGCTPDVIEALRKELINLNTAKKLSKLPAEEQDAMLAGLLDPAKSGDLKKALTKQVEGAVRPGQKTLRETLKQVETYRADTDIAYRQGAAMGIKFALGLTPVELLYAPPEGVVATEAADAMKRQVRAVKPKKQFPKGE